MRVPPCGELFAWEFIKTRRPVNIRVDAPLVFNNIPMRVDAALNGSGLAYLPEDQVLAHVDVGRLIRVLDDCVRRSAAISLTIPAGGNPRMRSGCW